MLPRNASSITELMGSGSAPNAHIAKSSDFMVAGKVSSASGLPPDSSTSRDVEASDMPWEPRPRYQGARRTDVEAGKRQRLEPA